MLRFINNVLTHFHSTSLSRCWHFLYLLKTIPRLYQKRLFASKTHFQHLQNPFKFYIHDTSRFSVIYQTLSTIFGKFQHNLVKSLRKEDFVKLQKHHFVEMSADFSEVAEFHRFSNDAERHFESLSREGGPTKDAGLRRRSRRGDRRA